MEGEKKTDKQNKEEKANHKHVTKKKKRKSCQRIAYSVEAARPTKDAQATGFSQHDWFCIHNRIKGA